MNDTDSFLNTQNLTDTSQIQYLKVICVTNIMILCVLLIFGIAGMYFRST